MKIRIYDPNVDVQRYNDFDFEGVEINTNSFIVQVGINTYIITNENGHLKVEPGFPEKVMLNCNKSCSYIEPVAWIRLGIKNKE